MSIFSSIRKIENSAEREATIQFNNKCQEETRYTPDIFQLERRQFQHVFLYNHLMRGQYKHDELVKDHGEFQGNAFTRDKFTLWRKNLGKLSYPIALKTPALRVEKAPIKGELFKMNSSQLVELDKEMENTVSFHRIRTTLRVFIVPVIRIFHHERIEIPSQDGGEPTFTSWTGRLGPEESFLIHAWMYVGADEYWQPLLDGGYHFKPVRQFERNKTKEKYFYFSPMELTED